MAWVGWDLNDQQVSILCCWTGLPPASFLQQLCRQGVLQMPFCCTFMLDLIQPNCEEEILPLFLHRLLLPLLGHEHDCPFPCQPVFSYHQKILKFQPLKASIQTRICAHLHFICGFFFLFLFFSLSFFLCGFINWGISVEKTNSHHWRCTDFYHSDYRTARKQNKTQQ